ncbi:MAG: EamA family transporter, partial [Alphaproteobacteria bacterium]
MKAWLEALPVPVRGALWMVTAAASFSLMTAMIRPAAEELHPFEIVFFRNVFGLILLSPWMLRSGARALRTRHLGWHALRGCLFLGAMLCWFSAIPMIPLVQAVAL